VSLSPPVGADWLVEVGDAPENRLDPYGDVVEWLVRKTESASQVLVPIQIYGLRPDGKIVEGPLYGQANIVADPLDIHDESSVRVMAHIPGVIAYWAVPVGIVGAPDVVHRTIRTGVNP